jgi:hypothetical protein
MQGKGDLRSLRSVDSESEQCLVMNLVETGSPAKKAAERTISAILAAIAWLWSRRERDVERSRLSREKRAASDERQPNSFSHRHQHGRR